MRQPVVSDEVSSLLDSHLQDGEGGGGDDGSNNEGGDGDPRGAPLLSDEVAPDSSIRRSIKKQRSEFMHIRTNELVRWRSQLCRWFAFPNSNVMDAERFSAASTELFGVILVLAAIVTVVFRPDVYGDNPLKDVYGYNNICVSMDVPPARYIASVMWPLVVYFQIECTRLTVTRILHGLKNETLVAPSRWLPYAMIGIHLNSVLAVAGFGLIFVISPMHSLRGHSYPFAFYGFSKVTSLGALCAESSMHSFTGSRKLVTNGGALYVSSLWALTVLLILLVELTYRHHDAHPNGGSRFPWYVMFALDWSWFGMMCFSGNFLPHHPILVRGAELHPDTIKRVEETLEKKRQAATRKRTGIHWWIHERLQKWHQRSSSGEYVGPRPLAVAEEPLDAMTMRGIEEAASSLTQRLTRDYLHEHPHSASINRGHHVTTLKAVLTTDERLAQLHPSLRVGLFGTATSYHGICRLNVTDRGAARLSVRLGVPEEMAASMLPDCETPGQIDLLFAEGLKEFLIPVELFPSLYELNMTRPTLLKALLSWRTITTFFRGFRRATAGSLDASTGLLGKEYYGGLPYKCGPSACKWALRPQQSHSLDPSRTPSLAGGEEKAAAATYAAGLVDAMEERSTPPAWDFVVQPAVHKSCSIEKADAHWDETHAPFVAVGTLTLLPEAADPQSLPTPLHFSAWNQLEDHKPLGRAQLLRRSVYRTHREGCPQEPAEIAQKDLVCPFLAAAAL